MSERKQELIKFFEERGGVVRFSSVIKAGFHSDLLSDLYKKKHVKKIARGLYCLSTFEFDSHHDLIIATLQAKHGIVCLISSLYFHEVTGEIPKVVDMAIPKGTRMNKVTYPPVRFYKFSNKAWEAGIEEYQSSGHSFRVYSLAKTIADCFKFRNKIGVNIARSAMKVAINEKKVKPTEIMKYAKVCRVDKIIKPILETMI